ncbi:hypothetical protein KEM48_007997 [Puccinia striiformis f. sp. tritici PST-130]|nr:hypothetical protein H4Q26_008148 [Puccinia striiformis f. sp. tritici PST-130]KAI9620648.1 hypothetical protein KEM48_007997 [Puccinia striiformis f. sp. tritici PST-130]
MSKDPNRAALLSRTGSYNQNSSYGSSPQSTSNIPSYGRSYGSESRQIPLSSSSSPFTNHQTSEELESQNDDAILGLSAKVRLLQEITVNIGTEVKDSNNILATLKNPKRMINFQKQPEFYQEYLKRWIGWQKSNMGDGGIVSLLLPSPHFQSISKINEFKMKIDRETVVCMIGLFFIS